MEYVVDWMSVAERGATRRRRAPLELQQERWPEYFEALGGCSERMRVSLEVVDERGRLDGPRRRPPELRAIGYDRGQDLLELATGAHDGGLPGLRYFIAAPRQIRVERWGARIDLLIGDASGTRTLIRLFDVPPTFTGRRGAEP
jgi:hypothetical protein